jgi:tetratricopeptide (TPR) repeat protein
MKAFRWRELVLSGRVVCLLWVLASACKHVPTEQEQQGALIHHDLGVQAIQSGNVQGALREFQIALELDPNLAEAHYAIGTLLHLSFSRREQAIEHFNKALAIRPNYSEARANLANVYLDLGQYDRAIALYREVLSDVLYPTPYIAQGNLGWALYKKGDTRGALENIRGALIANPKFCQGYRNLGIIYRDQGNFEDACQEFSKYEQACPDAADAYYEEGKCLTKRGRREAAMQAFAQCQAKATNQPSLKDDCRKLQEQLQ